MQTSSWKSELFPFTGFTNRETIIIQIYKQRINVYMKGYNSVLTCLYWTVLLVLTRFAVNIWNRLIEWYWYKVSPRNELTIDYHQFHYIDPMCMLILLNAAVASNIKNIREKCSFSLIHNNELVSNDRSDLCVYLLLRQLKRQSIICIFPSFIWMCSFKCYALVR